MFNYYHNTKSNYNILCFIWQSAIDHPRNNKKRKERKIKVSLNVNKTQNKLWYSLLYRKVLITL